MYVHLQINMRFQLTLIHDFIAYIYEGLFVYVCVPLFVCYVSEI